MNTSPLNGGVTAIRGARVVVITRLLRSWLASAISAEVPLCTLVSVFTFTGIKCREAPYRCVTGVICTGVSIVANLGIESDTDPVFTLVCVGTDIAIITEQAVVNGMAALQCVL